MSFDLFFSSASPSWTRAGFTSYFADRPHYQVKADQAVYENDDTGVYFSFDWNAAGQDDMEVDDDDEDEEAPRGDYASFNINFNRPRIFALEAAEELQAFATAFKATVDDPQAESDGRGEFTRASFLKSWNAGNTWATKAMLSSRSAEDNQPPLQLPASTLEQVWRWNISRQERQDEIDWGYVPNIMLVYFEGRVQTCALWPDGCPILLPQTDMLLLVRDEIRGFSTGPEGAEYIPIKTADATAALEPFLQHAEPLPHLQLDYEETPEAIHQLFVDADQPPGEFERVGFDMVIDEDLLTARAN